MSVETTTILATFGVMIGLMLLGIPVAVVMMAVGVGGGLLLYGPSFLNSAAAVVWSVLNDNLLTGIPLFILLGELLLRSGMADRMYVALAAWLSRIPGGLLHTNIGSCALFAATSGSSVATAATVGTVALPALAARKYPLRASLGSLAAGGTLGILIPPSVNMIVYGSLTQNSIGKLFMAGIIPGILLSLCFMGYIFTASLWRGERHHERAPPLFVRLRLLVHLLPPLIIFGIIMGSIYLGVATVTESAAFGVVAALLLIWMAGRLSMNLLRKCFIQSAKISGMVLLIIVSAFVLNLLVSLSGAAGQLTKWVTSFGLSSIEMLLLLILFYLLLGMFMDAMSMLVATVPITYTLVTALGVDPIWYGIFIILMCEMALISPPVGMNLFVVHGIRPDKGGIEDVAWGVLPYIVILLLFAGLLMAFPGLVTWLPQAM